MNERKEQFTPGPWLVTYTNTFEGYQGLGIIGSVVNITIGNHNFPLGVSGIQCSEEVERDYKTAIANARLIAAVPELYSSLKDMLLTVTDLLEAIRSGEGNTDCLLAVVQDEIDNAIQVLKKARGDE